MTWITDRPLVSHGLLGLLYAAVLIGVLRLSGMPTAELTGFLLVVMHFYSREVGQLGHDLRGEHGEAKAALLALGPGWSLHHLAQVLSPTISAAAVSMAAYTLL